MANTKLTKCNFCNYATGSGCMVTPNSYYCKKANEEYYQYMQNNKVGQTAQKSLRSWDRKI